MTDFEKSPSLRKEVLPPMSLGLFAEGEDSRHAGSRALGGGVGGGSSSHGISCNILPAKLIQIGLDMNI